MYTIEELINIILSKSEQLEESMKQESDLEGLTVKQLYCIELIHEMENPTSSVLKIYVTVMRSCFVTNYKTIYVRNAR